MKRLSTAVFIALFVLALVGLTPPAYTAKLLVVYVHNNDTPNQVRAYSLAKDGTLAELAGSPYDANNTDGGCTGHCNTLACGSRKKPFIFVAGGNGISAFRRAKDGTLTLVGGSPFGAGTRFLGVAVVEMGRRSFVYGNDGRNDQIRGYECNDGVLTELASSPYPTGEFPDGMAAAKGCLFVVNCGDKTLWAYKVNTNGSLTPAPGTPTAPPLGFILSCSVDPKGKFLYVPDFNLPQMMVYAINKKTCALTVVPGSPFALSSARVSGIALSKKMAVAVSWFDQAAAFRSFKPGKKGVPALLGAVQATVAPGGVEMGVLDSKGKLLVVGASNDDLVISYRVNKKTGAIVFADQIAATLGDFDVNGMKIIKP